MTMPNAYITKCAEAEINRRIKRRELILPADAEANLMANLEVWTKMMTIAVNKGCGIGKRRFQERVQPLLDQLQEEYICRRKNDGAEYADSVLDRLYAEIMD